MGRDLTNQLLNTQTKRLTKGENTQKVEGRIKGRKEMFYLRLYGIGHMVKDHSDSERKPAATTWATLSDYQQGFFYMHHSTDRRAHTTAFVTPVMEHWLEQEIALNG